MSGPSAEHANPTSCSPKILVPIFLLPKECLEKMFSVYNLFTNKVLNIIVEFELIFLLDMRYLLTK